MRAAKLSNRMLTTGKSILRAIRDETTGGYAWFDNKYLKNVRRMHAKSY